MYRNRMLAVLMSLAVTIGAGCSGSDVKSVPPGPALKTLWQAEYQPSQWSPPGLPKGTELYEPTVSAVRPPFDDERIYITESLVVPDPPLRVGSSSLIAIDRATGKELWRWDGEGRTFLTFDEASRPTPVAGRYVVVAYENARTEDEGIYLAVLDASTGRQLWKKLTDGVGMPMTFADDDPVVKKSVGHKVVDVTLDVATGKPSTSVQPGVASPPQGPEYGGDLRRHKGVAFYVSEQDRWSSQLGREVSDVSPAEYNDDMVLVEYRQEGDGSAGSPVSHYVLLDRKTGRKLIPPAPITDVLSAPHLLDDGDLVFMGFTDDGSISVKVKSLD